MRIVLSVICLFVLPVLVYAQDDLATQIALLKKNNAEIQQSMATMNSTVNKIKLAQDTQGVQLEALAGQVNAMASILTRQQSDQADMKLTLAEISAKIDALSKATNVTLVQTPQVGWGASTTFTSTGPANMTQAMMGSSMAVASGYSSASACAGGSCGTSNAKGPIRRLLGR